MPDVDDMALVREYVERKSEPAFAELVRRHINLVYSVAWRCCGSPEDAQDVAQAVFVILAQKAAGLSSKTNLTGWLYETTRFTGMRLSRTKARRQAREQEAYVQSTLNEPATDGVWKQLAPLLEEGMSRLNEKERALLALRYFENKTGAETAALLGIQEWAAHKRATRAVDKLRVFFARRGVVVPAAALTAALSAHSVQAAPAMLAQAVTAGAIATGAAGGVATFGLIKGTVNFMAWTKTQTALVATLVVGLGTLSVVQHRAAVALREQNDSLRRRLGELSQLASANEQLSNRLAQVTRSERLASDRLSELLRNRAKEPATNPLPPATPAARPAEAATPRPAGQELPKEAWTDAGFATPQAALQTRGWTVLNGDREVFKRSLFITPDARQAAEDALVKMAQASTDPNKDQFIQEILDHKYGVEEGILMPMMAENRSATYTGYKILSQQAASADEVVMEVETEMASGPAKTETLKFQRFGADWKVVIDKEHMQRMMGH